MLPQGYELWLAEDLGDNDEILLGRVIGWHIGREIKEHDDSSAIFPLVAYENRQTGAGSINIADTRWYLAPTRQEALAKAEHARLKAQP
ncbi:hypothetical protein [Actinoplanes sp. M2I2]|uniref:hypothetical protein n=1 Tax=Actinoplanes sp. M2I2 TaxID=1734444 RepID=UPI002021D35B|nr:hypothetical protein [Actinoplanes sp. M2I2]